MNLPEKPNYDCPERFEKTYRRLDYITEPKTAKILIIGDAQKVESEYLREKGYKNITSTEYDYVEPGQVRLDIENERLKETFDVVFCSHVLEHLRKPEKGVRYLLEMLDGTAYIFVPEQEICRIYDYHESCLSLDEWIKLFGKVESSKQFLNNDQEEYFIKCKSQR